MAMDILAQAREIDAIAQSGLHYSKDPFDIERFTRLRAIAADMLAGISDCSPAEILAWRAHDFGYATPKVDVRAMILDDSGKILLVRETLDDGRWTLPGGWADVNESPAVTVVREVKEESGYDAEVARLLAVLDREKQGHPPAFPYHIYKMFFHCHITGGAPQTSIESSESAFHPVDALPDLSLSRVLPEQIRRMHTAVITGELLPWCD